MRWLLFILPFNLFSQTITLTPIGTQDVSGIPVSVEHQITTGNGTDIGFAEGSVVVDPWRKTPQAPGITVIHYGNTRSGT